MTDPQKIFAISRMATGNQDPEYFAGSLNKKGKPHTTKHIMSAFLYSSKLKAGGIKRRLNGNIVPGDINTTPWEVIQLKISDPLFKQTSIFPHDNNGTPPNIQGKP